MFKNRVRLLCIFILFQHFSYSWYSNYRYRKPLTNRMACISDLTNFPVCIMISNNADLAGKASNNGYDLVFTRQDGSSRLSHEIEYYDSGTVIAWVSIPLLSATEISSNIIYLYYDKYQPGNRQDAQNVWNTDHEGVYHLNENPDSGLMTDSSGRQNNGTVGGNGMLKRVPGKIGFCCEWTNNAEDNGQYIDLGTGITNNLNNDFTISHWVLPDNNNSGTFARVSISAFVNPGVRNGWYFGNISISSGTTNHDYSFYTYETYGDDTDGVKCQSFWSNSSNNWVQVVGVFDAGSSISLYTNGVLVGADSTDVPAWLQYNTTENKGIRIGTRAESANDSWDGLIDEVRISHTAHSAGWILTSYSNQASPVQFISLGSEELNPHPIISRFVPDTALAVKNSDTVLNADAEILIGTLTNLTVNFGDSLSLAVACSQTSVNDLAFTHSFREASNYIITLTVYADTGKNTTNTIMLSVLPYLPHNTYNINPAHADEGILLSWQICSSANIQHYNIYRNNEFLASINNTSPAEYYDKMIVYGLGYQYYIETVYGICSVFSATNNSRPHDQHVIKKIIGTGGGEIANVFSKLVIPADAMYEAKEIILSVLSNECLPVIKNGDVYNQIRLLTADGSFIQTKKNFTLLYKIPVVNDSVILRSENVNRYLPPGTKEQLVLVKWDNSGTWHDIANNYIVEKSSPGFSVIKISGNINTFGTFGIRHGTDNSSAGNLLVQNRIFAPASGYINLRETSVFIPNFNNEAVNIKIFNQNGCLVYTCSYPDGISYFSWDGKDKNGTLAASGLYIMSILVGNNFKKYSPNVFLLK
ncbi:MAG TPA: hypothetical protein DC049_00090 [Spirochaetia bacterium]|nr:hypothetical protein [Spirochaetia bacterium]